MRKVLALVALAACDGASNSNNNMTADASVMVDATATPDAIDTVDGEWQDTYYTATGPVTANGCVTPPTAVLVDPTSAVLTQYSGTCVGSGMFRIVAPGNLGAYFLRVGGVLYETNKRTGIDLSTDRLGRADIAAITGVTLDLTMTNMQAWTTSDVLVAFASNIGYRQNLSFTAGAPSATNTTLTATANWNGYKVDGTKLDNLQILQLGKHTSGTGNYDFVSLDRVYSAPTFTMENNTPVVVNGSFTTATAGSVTLAIDVASFNQFAAAAGPTTTTKTVQGTTYAAASTDVIDSPPLISFAQSSENLTTMNFGTLFFTDPFPSTWTRMVKVQVGFAVPYQWNGSNGSLNALAVRVQPKTTADAGTIIANIGPPTQVQFDGADALTEDSISTVPVLSWQPPTVGNATDYEVQVYEVKTAGSSLTFTSVLRLTTKQTSLRIPSGYLLGQRQYVFSVRARNRGSVDVYNTPLKNGAAWSSADVLTNLVTTGS